MAPDTSLYPFLRDEEALETFVQRWLSGILPKAEWTHAAHVAVTGYYAFDRDAGSVFSVMKQGILSFNEASGTVNGTDSGYHETLTRFWSDAITRRVHDAEPASRLEGAGYVVQLFGEDRPLPKLYYSFDVVRDRTARREWIPPDRQPDQQ